MVSLKDFYEKEARIKEHEKDPNVNLRTRIIKSLVDGKSILDVGCGDGVHLRELAKTKKIFGVDFSAERLKKVNDKVICADARFLPFKEEIFESVYSSEVLEHLEDPKKATEEMKRVLENNGSLIISVPYKEKIEKIICMHCGKDFFLHGHLYSFDEEKIGDISSLKLERKKKAISRIVFNSFTIKLPDTLKYFLDKFIIFFVPQSARYIFVKFRK